MYWGHGNLVNWVTMEPGAEVPEEMLTSERIMVVMEGTVEQMIDGSYKTDDLHSPHTGNRHQWRLSA